MKRKKLNRETMLEDFGMLYDSNEMRMRLEEWRREKRKISQLFMREIRDDRGGRTRRLATKEILERDFVDLFSIEFEKIVLK